MLYYFWARCLISVDEKRKYHDNSNTSHNLAQILAREKKASILLSFSPDNSGADLRTYEGLNVDRTMRVSFKSPVLKKLSSEQSRC
jgi:hypothetical protein